MGSYIQNNLASNEKVLHNAKISIISLFPHIFWGILTLPLFIGIFFLISAAIRYHSTELAITNKRIISKFGIIKRSSVELSLGKVEGIKVEQGIIGRIFNYGSIIVSGTGGDNAPIPNISNPMEFRKKFFEVS